jgi:hypothetical protein
MDASKLDVRDARSVAVVAVAIGKLHELERVALERVALERVALEGGLTP